MRISLPLLLLALALLLAGGDMAWALAGRFHFDSAAFLRLGLLAAALLAAARLYQTVRPDPRLAAMLFGTGFLCAFSLGASALNYLLLTVAGPRIDGVLAAMDRAMGFDWPAAAAFLTTHPALNAAALLAYSSMLPQVAVLTVALATIDPPRVYRFCAALALSALTCIALWALAPSFGAFSVYALDMRNPALALDGAYARELVGLLRHGPGLISPTDAKGLIGFPSYHATMALLVMWFARDIRLLRWPALALNGAVLLATPVQGGHHLVDVLGAFPVALAAIAAVQWLARRGDEIAIMVNRRKIFTITPVPEGLFCLEAEQNRGGADIAIKRKLSGPSYSRFRPHPGHE